MLKDGARAEQVLPEEADVVVLGILVTYPPILRMQLIELDLKK